MAINAAVSLALYKPLGIAGLVIGTAVASLGMTLGQGYYLSRTLGGIEGRETVISVAIMTMSAAGCGALGWLTWFVFDRVFGASLVAQIISVGAAITAGTAFYIALVLFIDLPEARQIQRLITSRLRPARSA
jgi:putative peptidoglycan lipid II flippase